MFVYSRVSPMDSTVNETVLEMHYYSFFFAFFAYFCISQLSTLLTYAPIEFRSFLFHLRGFSLSVAHRDVVLSQKRCNIIPKNIVTAAILFFNYLLSSIHFSDHACRINKSRSKDLKILREKYHKFAKV